MKHINLWRFLPACILLSIGLYALTNELPYLASQAINLAAIILLAVLIRLGRLPWFEPRDGKKQRIVIWLESKIPFFRAEFWRR